MELTDGERIKRCLDGHADEYRYFVERYQRPVLAFLTGRLGRADLAEEAAQEAFLRAYLNLAKLNNETSFYQWIFSIARNVALETVRAEAKQKKLSEMTPEKTLQNEYAGRYDLEKAVGRLPERCRELIYLRFYNGLSCREVARQLEMPIGTVTKTLSRAFLQLRDLLREESETE